MASMAFFIFLLLGKLALGWRCCQRKGLLGWMGVSWEAAPRQQTEPVPKDLGRR
jgi:hypothetical protein